MIGNDDVHTEFVFDEFHFLAIADTAVHRDDEPHIDFFRVLRYDVRIEPVSVFPFGHDGIRLHAELVERLFENTCGGNAVGVVIAEDENRFARVARFPYTISCLAHTLQQKGIVKTRFTRREKFLYAFRRSESSAVQKRGGIGQNVRGRGYARNFSLLFVREFLSVNDLFHRRSFVFQIFNPARKLLFRAA